MIDLAPAHFAIVRDILRHHVPDREVRAFGSRVRGNARPTSDLDLVIMTDEPLDPALQADLSEAFSEAPLPFKVDVVDWAVCDEAFRAIINENSLPVQRRTDHRGSGTSGGSDDSA